MPRVIFWRLYAVACLLTLMTASRVGPWPDKVVDKWLSQKHIFYPANSEHFEYNGRWVITLSQSRYDTSFVGAGVSFTVTNTSKVLFALGNANMKEGNEIRRETSTQTLEMEHFPVDSPPAGKITVHIAQDGGTISSSEKVFGSIRINNELQLNSTHTFELSKAGISTDTTPLQFRGIWLSQGGKLVPPDCQDSRSKHDTETISCEDTLPAQPYTWTRKHRIEVMAPANIFDLPLANTSAVKNTYSTTSAQTWLSLLSKDLPSTNISPLPYAPKICVSPTCRGNQRGEKAPTLADSYFRAGPVDTDLFKQPWFFTLYPVKPAVLVLNIGASDFILFLATSKIPNKHSLDTFITDFTRAYIEFIKNIRRTLHDSRPCAETQLGDEAYQYISAPSSFPIFLLTPIVPQTLRYTQIGMIVHKALREVAFHLQEAGDANVFVIDAANWFIEHDFTVAQCSSETNQDDPAFSLRETGHIKLAYHLSSMVCSYVGASGCPFERHSNYVGQLYLPEEIDMKRKLQEIKIAKLKGIFSVM